MSRILLRTLKRVTALEVAIEDFRQIVFSDLDMSVYEVEDVTSELTRAHSEHAATCLDRPTERGGLALHRADGGDVRQAPGRSAFAFTKQCHHNVCFFDDKEKATVAARVYEVRNDRARPLSVDEMKAYARARLRAGDEEWKAACGTKPKWLKCAASQDP